MTKTLVWITCTDALTDQTPSPKDHGVIINCRHQLVLDRDHINPVVHVFGRKNITAETFETSSMLLSGHHCGRFAYWNIYWKQNIVNLATLSLLVAP